MRICEVEGCGLKHHGKGYCQMHFGRITRYGSLELTKRAPLKFKDKRTYKSWAAMKERCYSKNYYQYNIYGGRGITVCDRWLGVDGANNFYEDMGERPTGTSLDRIDVNGNYEPSNCRRATAKEQANNRRTNVLYWGKNAKQISEETGINYQTIIRRVKHGWTEQETRSEVISNSSRNNISRLKERAKYNE